MRKRLAILIITMVLSMAAVSPVEASFSQTEKEKSIADFGCGFACVSAYAAFDRIGSNMGASKSWDYKAQVKVMTQEFSSGKLTMKITSFASLRTGSGAGITVGAGKSSTTVGTSSSATWTTVYSSYTQSTNVELFGGQLSKNSNVVVSPRRDFRAGTAGITVEGTFREKGTNRQLSITAAA